MNIFNSCQELENLILDLANREIAEYQKYQNYQLLKKKSELARVSNSKTRVIHKPEHWVASNLLNPFYVKSKRRQIARSLYNKLVDGSYRPKDALEREIIKPDGKKRIVRIYSIPDAAVSLKLYWQLLSKNKHRFSSHVYAYRDDRNAHYAIQDIAYDLSQYPRTFVSEHDFSKFFDTINHAFLIDQLNKNSFSVSDAEKNLIKAFLSSRDEGIPQGTSVSLFLANLVCWKLDKDLEYIGVRFARYADDTIIWSDSYEKILQSFKKFHEFSQYSGVKINFRKSDGISLLCTNMDDSEIKKAKTYVNFLGYSVSYEHIMIKSHSEKKSSNKLCTCFIKI